MANAQKSEGDKDEDILKDVDTELDYYEILGLDHMASLKQISKMWKVLVVKAHPDKCPDDPNAAQRFQLLRKAYNVLKDEKVKAAYDLIVRQRIVKKLNLEKMGQARRQQKESLEKREKQFQEEQQREARFKYMYEDQHRRAHAEREQMQKARAARNKVSRLNHSETAPSQFTTAHSQTSPSLSTAVRVSWKSKSRAYQQDELLKIFSTFGSVANVILSKKRVALVDFETPEAARSAAATTTQLGHPDDPLKISFKSPVDPILQTTEKKFKQESQVTGPSENLPAPHQQDPFFVKTKSHNSVTSDLDLEDLEESVWAQIPVESSSSFFQK